MLHLPNTRPRAILGLMNFGPETKHGARITSLSAFNSCLDTFQQAGYNEVDTARVYGGGTQEAFTAQAGWKDRGLTLATKWYPYMPGYNKAEKIKEQLNKSLEELQTDCVDIFYLHAPDRSVPLSETLEAVNDMFQQGKFLKLGLSNYAAFEVAEVCMLCREKGWVQPTVYQGVYNPITRSIEAELIPACRRYGLSIVVYNPLAGGLFSGKIKALGDAREGRFSDEHGHLGAMYRKRYFNDATFNALRLITLAAEKHNLTLLETAFRWVLHHSALDLTGNDGIIIGVGSPTQLRDNLADLEKGPLPEMVVHALNDAWLVAKASTPNYWSGELEYTYQLEN